MGNLGQRLSAEEQAEWDAMDSGGDVGTANAAADAPREPDARHGKADAGAADDAGSDNGAGDAGAAGAEGEEGRNADGAADPFANLNPQVRDYIVGLQAQTERDTQRIAKLEGHIGAVRNEIAQLRQPKPEPKPLAAKVEYDAKAIEAFERDYPELAGGVKSILSSAQLGLPKSDFDAEQFRGGVIGQVATLVQSSVDRLADEMSVEIAHRGWKRTTAAPQFVAWKDRQPREVQTLYTSSHPDDVIRLLDLYEDARKTQDTRNRRLRSAAAVSDAGAGSRPRVKSVDEMSFDEAWDHYDKLDARQQAGR